MNIRFNSEYLSLEAPVSLLCFLQSQLNDSETVFARSVVAVNQQLVPKQEYADYILQDNDDIELLTAVVGG